MSILWEVFEIAVNFFQGFILAFFPYAYLGDKHDRKFHKSPGIIYAVITAAAISVMNYLTVFEHFYALTYAAVIFTYSLRHLKGTMLKKIFAVIFPNLIMAAISVLTVNLFSVLFNIPPEFILNNYGTERLLTSIAAQILIICTTSVSLKILKNSDNKNFDLAIMEWILILIVLAISIIICAFLNFASFEISSSSGRTYIVAAFIGIVLINVVVYYLLVALGKKNAAVRENEILKLQQEYNRQYIINANTEYDLIKKMRHDFKDSYSVIHTLLSEEKSDKAMEYIENNIDTLSQTEIFVRTENDIVNAVVNAKLSAAKSFGIDSTCLSVMDFDGINDLDLCRLLSNMLENAVTACMKSKSKHRSIDLKISCDGYNYTFSLKNTIDSSVLKENPALETTKSDNKSHGFGTKIISDIAVKYNGRCDFYEEDDLFCCNVILRK
ncbi:MAG: GHKL domain-containing protein [Oscillospiraceae bacterium]|nr:GHKL domain-containing protein [Oscillospiraceae bacterium]